jgi:hypothetical protein
MKIKKWNGSSWVQDYPEVNIASIVATGTPGTSTYLRGDGQWINPIPTNNVAGTTFPGAFSQPGGGTNTGVILYGDFYGWHTRAIGSNGQILTSNGSTPNWVTPNFAASSHTHPYSDLTGTVPTWNQNTTGTAANVTGVVAVGNGGTGQTTLALARNAMGLGNTTGAVPVANGGTGTTSVNQGGVVFGNTGGGSYTSTATPSALNQYLGVTGGANNQPLWTTPADSQSASAIGTGSALATERDIYYGLPFINNSHAYTSSTFIYAPTSGGNSGQFLIGNGTSSTPTFTNLSTSITASAAVNSATAATINVTGYRMILVQVWRDATNQSYSFWVDLTDTTYNFSTTARNLRFRWWDGTSGWDNTITVQNSSGLRLQHNAGGTFIFKCTGVR